MKTGRPAVPIELSDEERSELLRRSRQRKGPAESRIRAEIILACASGESGTSIANRFGIGVHTVSRWRVRFSRLRLDGLNDEQRSGRPRSITDEQVQAVVDQVLKSKPKDASHWSTRSMSQATGISPASVMRIWHAFGLGSVRKVLWERACPAMECEALLYPISNGVKEAANSGFAAALRQIAGQVGSPHRRSHKTFRTEPVAR